MRPDDRAAVEREWRNTIIAPALAHDRYTPERAAAVRLIAATPQHHPVRGREMIAECTVQRWVSDFETGGVAKLTRRVRLDAGTARVFISARYDKAARAAGFDDGLLAELRRDVDQECRDYWGNGEGLSGVGRLASDYLADRTRREGAGLDGATLAKVCRLPRALVESQRKFRRVHELRTDRKAFEDRRPRIVRSRDGLAPMQLVIGDVHHCDVLLRRDDGSTATPKMIAFLDVGTGRVWAYFVLCEAGRAVRNGDLIRAFLAMVADPDWGMPDTLYLDNGSEYLWADFVKDALKLAGLRCEAGESRAGVIRATAYNAAAKGLIERAFGTIERTVFNRLPGYIGGDRMRSKSGNVGRPPAPYGGTFQQFEATAQALLGYYNALAPTRGDRPSPLDAYHRAVAAGWARTDADPDALSLAFSTTETRKVQDGKVTVAGRWYHDDALFAHDRETVVVRLAKYLDEWGSVPVYTLKGELIAVAKPEGAYGFLDKAGAVEAGRRKRVALATVNGLAKQVRPVDLTGRAVALGRAAKPDTPIPPSAGVIRLGDDAAELGRAVREDPDDRRDREATENQRRQRARNATLDRILPPSRIFT